MKINSSGIKIFIVLGMVLSGIAAGSRSEAVTLVGPKVTNINVAGPLTPEVMKMPAGSLSYQYTSNPVAVALPALVSAGVSGGAGRVATWTALSIPSARAATLARCAIQAAGMLAGAMIADWAAKKSLSWVNGQLGTMQTTTQPAAGTGPIPQGACPYQSVTYYSTQSAAGAACDGTSGCVGNLNWGPGGSLWANDWGAYWADKGTDMNCNLGGSYGRKQVVFVYPRYAGMTTTGQTVVPATDADIESKITDGLNVADGTTQGLVNEALRTLTEPVKNGNETGNYSPLSPANGSTVQNTLNQSIDNTTINNLTNTATNNYNTYNGMQTPASLPGTTPVDIVGQEIPLHVQVDNQQPELTQDQVRQAVKGGMDDAGGEPPGDLTPPGPEAEPSLPEKKQLSTVLDTFWDAIQRLPVVSMLSGLGLQASGGSPVVDVSIPKIFSEGSVTLHMDFSNDSVMGINYASVLAMVGNILLAMAGIRWTLYLFKSGE